MAASTALSASTPYAAWQAYSASGCCPAVLACALWRRLTAWRQPFAEHRLEEASISQSSAARAYTGRTTCTRAHLRQADKPADAQEEEDDDEDASEGSESEDEEEEEDDDSELDVRRGGVKRPVFGVRHELPELCPHDWYQASPLGVNLGPRGLRVRGGRRGRTGLLRHSAESKLGVRHSGTKRPVFGVRSCPDLVTAPRH